MKKILISFLGTLVVFGFLSFPSGALAAVCDLNNSNPTADEAICNPSEPFYVDLGGDNNFNGLLLYIIRPALALAGTVAVLFIIIGGFQYITSRGNEEQAEAGRKTLTNAIIGLAIIILSYVIVVVVINALFAVT